MKKLVIIVFFLALSFGKAYSQWEYQYFSLRLGASHNLFSPQPNNAADRIISTPLGDMRSKKQAYNYYGISPALDLLFNYDFKNEKFGIVTGLEYVSNGIGAKYATTNGAYTLTEKYKVTSLGVPLFFKFSSNMYQNMSYFFVGTQFNWNLNATLIQESSWGKYVGKIDKAMLKKYNFVYFMGYNYSIFNLEVGLMPSTFLNTNYQSGVAPDGHLPFSSQKKNIFYVKTSINLPFSEWLMSKSWHLEKIRRSFVNFY